MQRAPDDRRPGQPRSPAEPRIRIAGAWAALAWERIWPALWPVALLLGGLVALALFDLLPALPGWLHLSILIVALLALLALGARGLIGLKLPTEADARRRLETDSGLAHRPLSALRDSQATGSADAGSRALWSLHQEALRRAAGLWRLRAPRPGVPARDRFGASGLVVLLLALAVVGGWGEWSERAGRALTPRFAEAATEPPPVLDLFITPPAHTGLAPLYLRAERGEASTPTAAAPEPVSIPVGSALLARVGGGGEIPVLRLAEALTPFTSVDGDTFEISGTVTGGSAIAVTQGEETLGAWPIRVIPDGPPEIGFAEPPGATERFALHLSYLATDDYGIDTVQATLTLPPDAPEALDRTPIVIDLPVPGRLPREAEGSSYHDLTPHPWAGQRVMIALAATDAAGQTGHAEPVETVLPERQFTHPVARAIIEQRRALMLDPASRDMVAEVLNDLSLRPDRYYDDIVVFLALRTAARRLALQDDVETLVDPVQRLLWDTALRIEDGDLSLAERDLRDAQQALAEALENGASDERISELMDELRQALDRYLAALQQQMMERLARGEELQTLPMTPENAITRDQLQEMLDRMQELSETGARDAAREMLAQMQEMLENLQNGQMAQSPRQDQANERFMEMMEQLQSLTEAQRELLDQTFRNSQQNQQGQQQGQQGQNPPGQNQRQQPGDQPGRQPGGGQGDAPSDFPAQGARIQEALRRALGEMMRQMGEMTGSIPAPFGQAEQAMRRSEQALGGGQPGQAVGPQTEALDQLQQGMEGLVDQMMEQMARQGMQPQPGQPSQRIESGRDPLGRPTSEGGNIDSGDVRIPEEADIQRARQILDELRRRLGERDRPELEHEYIERLLRRF